MRNFILLLALSSAFSCTTLRAASLDGHAPEKVQARQIAPAARKPASTLEEAGDLAETLVSLIAEYRNDKEGSLRDPAFKEKLVKVGAALDATGKLETSLDHATKLAKQRGLLPNLDEASRGFLVTTISSAIHAELQSRGLTADGQNRVYQSWDDLGHEIHSKIDHLSAKQLHVGTPEYWDTYRDFTHSEFSSGNAVKILVNGPASFEERAKIIDSAQKEILVMSWAVEDDTTGAWLKERLLKKASEGVKVKVMVDGLTSYREGYSKILGELEAAGIEVVRWRSTDSTRSFDGQHRKMLIVDGKTMVGGGLNWGDHYSHLDAAHSIPWRDTDLAIEGPAVQQGRELFRSLWNEAPGAKSREKILFQAPVKSAATNATSQIAIVNHQPGKDSNILSSLALSIRSAKKEIYIENAYFILDPVVEQAVRDARARGVRVVVMTNSSESVDEPTVSRPIMKSVNKLIDMGAEVYLKPGHLETLHSKAMMVDGESSWVGSQNFHPRSTRYEGEVILSVKGKEFAADMKKMFDHDISTFTAQTTPVVVKDDALADLQEDLFFDQL
ncbi:MAG: phosphatidylserine/phosphatidylglycerophosphate/cardiolipin synthase family protein [Bdellovibrionota bacterium]